MMRAFREDEPSTAWGKSTPLKMSIFNAIFSDPEQSLGGRFYSPESYAAKQREYEQACEKIDREAAMTQDPNTDEPPEDLDIGLSPSDVTAIKNAILKRVTDGHFDVAVEVSELVTDIIGAFKDLDNQTFAREDALKRLTPTQK